jgi:cytochrome P450
MNGSPGVIGPCPVNGSYVLSGSSAVTGSSPPAHAMGLKRPPGPSSWRGLPPGPRMPYPLQIVAFLHRRRPFLERCRARYGSPFTLRFRVPPVPGVVICKPDQIKQMFQAPPDVLWAADGSSDLHKYFGSPGLAYFEEDEHLVRRKLVNRSIHGEAMRQLSASIETIIERELSSWPRGEFIELFPRFRRLAIDVMRHASFGPEPDERLNKLVDVIEDEIYPTGETPLALVEDQYLSPSAVRLLTVFRPYRRILEARARADRLIYDVIEDRRRTDSRDGHDTLSVLLSATNADGSPLTAIEIRNDIMTNLLAGSATTASAMAWAVERLARQPATRERLVAEIDAGQDDAYLTATVQEILRRKPPLPAPIPRLVRKPFELDGYVLPPGVRLVASASLLHHDPSIYPDPYAFRPERFLENPPGNYTWIPFGGGRRRCLGKALAEYEIKAALGAFFRRFDVRPDRPEPETDRSLIAVIRPSHDTRVEVSERS